jgi:hypothetical protein
VLIVVGTCFVAKSTLAWSSKPETVHFAQETGGGGGSSGLHTPILTGFQTWSLFLVCDPAWLNNDENSKHNLTALHTQFLGFGRAIGSKNLAVWFGGSTLSGHLAGPVGDSKEVVNYDADEAINFCTQYGLVATESPCVIVTTQYPEENRPHGSGYGNYYKISLSNLDADQMERLLGSLADHVRSSELSQQKFDSERYWALWDKILRESVEVLGLFARGVKVTINTAVIKVEISGDKVVAGH